MAGSAHPARSSSHSAYSPRSIRVQASLLRQQFLQGGGLPFTDILTADVIAAASGWKDSRNDPSRAITFREGAPLDRDAVLVAVQLGEELGTCVRRPLAAWRRGAGRQLRGDSRPAELHRVAEGARIANRRLSAASGGGCRPRTLFSSGRGSTCCTCPLHGRVVRRVELVSVTAPSPVLLRLNP